MLFRSLAASREPDRIFSVVSRGGRPDLAAPYLPSVAAPTLLIVGEKDEAVVDYNFSAMKSLKCTKRIELVPGASHLFEETGALERVANIAAEWFLEYSGEKSRKAIEKYEEKKIRKIAG